MNVIFTLSLAKITVNTTKCTGTHRNFSSATMNYPNAFFAYTGPKKQVKLGCRVRRWGDQ